MEGPPPAVLAPAKSRKLADAGNVREGAECGCRPIAGEQWRRGTRNVRTKTDAFNPDAMAAQATRAPPHAG